jgi:hypothetical protein
MQAMFMKRAVSGMAGAAPMAAIIAKPLHYGQDPSNANDN